MAAGLVLLAGCATPPPVKQAVASLDEGYAQNLELMRQYRELVQNINDRHRLWTVYVQDRAKLDLALQWATSDPKPIQVDGRPTEEQYTAISHRLLGPEVTTVINQMRLSGLPERETSAGTTVFAAGTNDMTKVVQSLPALVNVISDNVRKEYERVAAADLSGFDAYATNVVALRQINKVIRGYLNVDITVQREDVRDIADSIRELAR